jgi:signal transduction histidine kinase
LNVTVSVNPGLKLIPEELTIFIFDAVRELLLNVTKHAKVSVAEVSVDPAGRGNVRVEVKDSGVGRAPSPLQERKFGLFSILERTEDLGGGMEIVSAPGKGFAVALTLPIRRVQTR